MPILTLAVGDCVNLEMPFSEVCMFMQISGKMFRVIVQEDAAQPINPDGSRFCPAITWGEAGIYRDNAGRPYLSLETCQTLRCTNTATVAMTYTARGQGPYTDKVCESCLADYRCRVVLSIVREVNIEPRPYHIITA